jgi:predicted anti-sigma-YlaC factor YlaD
MTCREVTDTLDRYLDGELSTSAHWALKLHFLICSDCRNYLRTYKLTIRAAKAYLDLDGAPPADMPDELVKAIFVARSRTSHH